MAGKKSKFGERASALYTKSKQSFLSLWAKWWGKTLIILVLFLIVLRIILSPVATFAANKYLAKKVPGYYGHVDCIHFALIRGAYKVDSFLLDKVDSVTGKRTPFVSLALVDLSVEWKALFHGSLVGEIYVNAPEVRFTKDKVEPAQVAKDSTTFKHLLDIGMPLDINRVEVENGRVRYRDETTEPQVDISATGIYILATNLSNSYDSTTLLPSSIEIRADVYGGSVDVGTKLNLLADNPTFDLKAEVKKIDLPQLNDFFKAYAKFTIEKGDFSLYAEAAAKDGAYTGYVKPLINNLKVVGPSDKDESFLIKMWEHVVGAVAFVFKNHKEDQLGTKVPFNGEFGEVRAGVLYAIFQVLRNAFIEALSPAIDNEVNIATVGMKEKNMPGSLLRKNVEKKNNAEEKDKKSKRQKKKDN